MHYFQYITFILLILFITCSALDTKKQVLTGNIAAPGVSNSHLDDSSSDESMTPATSGNQPVSKSKGIDVETSSDEPHPFNIVKNLHYIIPNSETKREHLSQETKIGSLPEIFSDGVDREQTQSMKNIQQTKTQGTQELNTLQKILQKKDFDFDGSRESFAYKKGKSLRMVSNSYCVKITPLYSEEDACEKELVKISQKCYLKSYETFKTKCTIGTDFISDESLRLNDYLYSISPDTLVFTFKDGSCFRKVYNKKHPNPEPMVKSYCDYIKRQVANNEAKNSGLVFDDSEDIGKMEDTMLKEDGIQQGTDHEQEQNIHQGSYAEEENYSPQGGYTEEEDNSPQEQYQDQKDNVQEEQHTEQTPSNNRETVNDMPNEKSDEKRKASALHRIMESDKNPLRRLLRWRRKPKDYNIVLIYDKSKQPYKS